MAAQQDYEAVSTDSSAAVVVMLSVRGPLMTCLSVEASCQMLSCRRPRTQTCLRAGELYWLCPAHTGTRAWRCQQKWFWWGAHPFDACLAINSPLRASYALYSKRANGRCLMLLFREAQWKSSLSHEAASLHNLTDTIPIEAIVRNDTPHVPQASGSVPQEADEGCGAGTVPSLPLPGEESEVVQAVLEITPKLPDRHPNWLCVTENLACSALGQHILWRVIPVSHTAESEPSGQG